jgi:hypothetical protein
MGGMVSEIQARLALIEKFPALEGSGFDVTSPIDYGYNCIAWAAGDNSKWWWPGNSETFWPAGCDSGVKVSSFVEAFQNLGYEKCKLEDDWTQFEYVAIYKLNGSPSHAARQFGLVTVWFRSPVYHYATLASKAKGLMPPRYEWRRRAL